MTNISTYEMLDVIFNNIDHVLCVSNADAEDFKILYVNDTYETLGIGKDLLNADPNVFLKISNIS